MNKFETGLEAINNTIEKDDVYIQSVQMFGDTLHASIVVDHYRKQYPNRRIVWGVGEKYADEYSNFDNIVKNVKIIKLPHTPVDDEGNQIRRNWIKECKAKIKFGPCVAVSGYHTAGDIATNFMVNAGIKKLSVQRKPILPLSMDDVDFANKFIEKHSLSKFIALEYNSITFSGPPHFLTWKPEQYESVIKLAEYPIVYLGSSKDPELAGGVDGRGTTFRQAKAIIKRASLFVGCGSGLTMVAASRGVDTPITEININNSINMRGCGYAQSRILLKCQPSDLVNHINKG